MTLEGHQPAHPMRLADGTPRTLPDGGTITLAGGTFTLTIAADGNVLVSKLLDDGRSFAYQGQCDVSRPEEMRCMASDGVGTPLNFVVTWDGTNGSYQSMGLDPAFVLNGKVSEQP